MQLFSKKINESQATSKNQKFTLGMPKGGNGGCGTAYKNVLITLSYIDSLYYPDYRYSIDCGDGKE